MQDGVAEDAEMEEATGTDDNEMDDDVPEGLGAEDGAAAQDDDENLPVFNIPAQRVRPGQTFSKDGSVMRWVKEKRACLRKPRVRFQDFPDDTLEQPVKGLFLPAIKVARTHLRTPR